MKDMPVFSKSHLLLFSDGFPFAWNWYSIHGGQRRRVVACSIRRTACNLSIQHLGLLPCCLDLQVFWNLYISGFCHHPLFWNLYISGFCHHPLSDQTETSDWRALCFPLSWNFPELFVLRQIFRRNESRRSRDGFDRFDWCFEISGLIVFNKDRISILQHSAWITIDYVGASCKRRAGWEYSEKSWNAGEAGQPTPPTIPQNFNYSIVQYRYKYKSKY